MIFCNLRLKIKYWLIKLVHYCTKNNNFTDENSNKILIIRLDEIGDMVLMTPFLREFKRNFPNAEITLLVKPQVYNLVELCPYVNKVLTFNRYTGRFAFLINIFKAYIFAVKYLQKEKFDLVVLPRWDTDAYGASYLAYFSKAKKSVAYSEKVSPNKAMQNKGFDKFFTDVIKDTKHLHEVERNLDVIRFLGGTVNDSSIESYIENKDNLITSEHSKNLQFVISTSTSSIDKEWNIENYKQIINKLKDKFNIDITLIGNGERAEKQAKFLEQNCDIKNNLINKTTLRESQAILKNADIYLGGDTGPTHLAASVGTRGIALYGQSYTPDNCGYNCQERFGPWQSAIAVLCPFKNEYGVNGITVDEVYSQLEKICVDLTDKKDEGIGGVEPYNELELWINENDEILTNAVILKNKINIILCPSAGSKHREWCIDKYCEVLNLLNKKIGINVIVLGDRKNTAEALEKLKENFNGKLMGLVGKTTLRETAALMMKADIYLGGDTGPMHIAAACKIDGVVISCHPQTGDIQHGNSPKRFGPWQSPLVVIQPKTGLDDCKDGCNKPYPHCINQITAEEVYKKLDKILECKSRKIEGGTI